MTYADEGMRFWSLYKGLQPPKGRCEQALLKYCSASALTVRVR